MNEKLPILECSIHDIYVEGNTPKQYSIPIYQRNYAWGREQIETLISDIYDAFEKVAKKESDVYYIGTLVTFKRSEQEFEVIDGQQRLTTLYLILKYLGITPKNTLTYTARKASAETLRNLPDTNGATDEAIKEGYHIVKKKIENIAEDIGDEKFKEFKQFFLHNVHIIHYDVPKGVDLNHYFEVMNSRGEQLEKHEIVKAMFSQSFTSDDENGEKDMAIFNAVWEACSDMSVYIQQRLGNPDIFGKNLDSFVLKSFEKIPPQSNNEQKCKISELLSVSAETTESNDNTALNDKFQPIIDFPNLLLIVLKLTRNNKEITLDDKELLKVFNSEWSKVADEEKAGFARLFAYNLLKAKYLLDNYIVHHNLSDNEQWKLERYFKDGYNYYTKQTANNDNQLEIVHLLSMFEVTFTAKQRKNYLFYCLKYLFDSNDINNFDKYLEFLQKLADKYFYDIYLNQEALSNSNQPKPNAFDDAILKDGELCVELLSNIDKSKFTEIYKEGSAAIPLYIFNYTDYRIWKKYATEMRGKDEKKGGVQREKFFADLGCPDFELEPFNNFYFSRTRKSLEHFYPQAKAIEGESNTAEALCQKCINHFGNFAMISSDANSSGSDRYPSEKCITYNGSKMDPIGVSSLKFKIMMTKCKDNHNSRSLKMAWNGDDIKEHAEKMLAILFR